MIYRRLFDGTIVTEEEYLRRKKRPSRKTRAEEASVIIKRMMDAAREKLKGDHYGIF